MSINNSLVSFGINGEFALSDELAERVAAGVAIHGLTFNTLPDTFYNVGCPTGSNGTNPACFNDIGGLVTTSSVEGDGRSDRTDYACFTNVACPG